MRQPICFIATSDPENAAAFYQDVLGLKLLERSAFALVFADSDISLRIQIVENFRPAAHTAHGWQVTDLKAEMAQLAAKGVSFLRFAALDQSPSGVWTSPDGHKIAWFNDPDGNVLSMTERC